MKMRSKATEIQPFEVINNNYRVIKLIGRGGFGNIYFVRDLKTNAPFAMKIEKNTDSEDNRHCSRVDVEYAFVRQLQNSLYFPHLYDCGTFNGLKFIVMEIMGPSLSRIQKFLPNKKYSLSTSLRIGIEMVCILHELHCRGLIHRDVKPENFLIRPCSPTPLCLCDFGLASKFAPDSAQVCCSSSNVDHDSKIAANTKNSLTKVSSNKISSNTCSESNNNINKISNSQNYENNNENNLNHNNNIIINSCTNNKNGYNYNKGDYNDKKKESGYFFGTLKFASMQAQQGQCVGPRDDMISWFYMMIELISGSLPWSSATDKEQIFRMKATTSVEELCSRVPKQFIDIYHSLVSLEYDQNPDYDFLILSLSNAMREGKARETDNFDWEDLPEDVSSRISGIPLDRVVPLAPFLVNPKGLPKEFRSHNAETDEKNMKNAAEKAKLEDTILLVNSEENRSRNKGCMAYIGCCNVC